MQVELTDATLTCYVEEKVRAGDFPTASSVVEHALTWMMRIDALCEAAFKGNLSEVKRLLEDDVPANAANHWGRTPLSLAEDVDVIRELLTAGARPDAAGENLLHGWVDAACDAMHQYRRIEPLPEHMEILRLLIAHGADPLAADEAHATALDVAQRYRCAPVIRFLEAAARKAAE